MPRTEPASPVELVPHRPEPLQRSHSAASIHSLPTPPPTRKRKRSRSTHSRAADSESEIDERDRDSTSEEEEMLRRKAETKGAVLVGSKKRKLLQVDMIAAELSGKAAEDEFWTRPYNTLADKAAKEKHDDKSKKTATSSRVRSESPELSPSASPPSRLLKRNRTGLPSPPQSKRRSSPRVKRFKVPQPILEEPDEDSASLALDKAPKTPTRLCTPPPKSKSVPQAPKKVGPERDTPNNPFLDSDESSVVTETPDAEGVVAGPSSEGSVPKPQLIEKPTLAYVFRGVRTEFTNPLYDPAYPETGVAPERDDDPHKLPLEHPEFEAEERCPPKMLFAEARKPSRRRRHVSPPIEASEKLSAKKARSKGKQTAPKQKSEWDTTDEEDNAPEQPEEVFKLPRTPPPRRSPRLARFAAVRPQVKGKERIEVHVEARDVRATPRLPAKDRSDPMKRAFGVHDRPVHPPRAEAAEPKLVLHLDEVQEVRLEAKAKATAPKPHEPADLSEVREVRETTHVKIFSRPPAKTAVPKPKLKASPKAAAVPVEDAEENPFL